VSARAACLAAVAALVWSGWQPRDRFTWWLEVTPVLIVLPILLATARRFPLTSLAYALIAVHATILCVGGHWTYAEVPLGFVAASVFGFARNHYDRLGHFAQGFVPAIVAREVLLRTHAVRRGWLAFVVIAICLAASALYELAEWAAAVLTSDGATAFLGTQGDPWDTQWDMLMALVGAVAALACLSRVHDRAVARVARAE
jgi:putative membrane protein